MIVAQVQVELYSVPIRPRHRVPLLVKTHQRLGPEKFIMNVLLLHFGETNIRLTLSLSVSIPSIISRTYKYFVR